MYFENELSFESEVKKIGEIFVYCALNKRKDLRGSREVYKIIVEHVDTKKSVFYKLHVCRLLKFYRFDELVSYPKISQASKPECIKNAFSCQLSKEFRMVRFGPYFNLGMLNRDYRNRGLGRFCMAWLTRKMIENGYGDCTVAELTLSANDATTEIDRDLRNNFYKNSGFIIDDIKCEDGHCSVAEVSLLRSKHNRAKVREFSPEVPLLHYYNKKNKLNLEYLKLLEKHEYFISKVKMVMNYFSILVMILLLGYFLL